jgi:hypothetical protein
MYADNELQKSVLIIGLKNFFEAQAKEVPNERPALTDDERVVLEFIKNFDYIGRNKKGLYYTLQDEDNKNKTVAIYNLTTNLFHFIKERRTI